MRCEISRTCRTILLGPCSTKWTWPESIATTPMGRGITTAMAATARTDHAMTTTEGGCGSVGTRSFLVRTHAKCEKKAQGHLVAQSFRIFLPQIQKTIRHARKLTTVQAPLFPGYLFIALDLDRDRWLSVRSTV